MLGRLCARCSDKVSFQGLCSVIQFAQLRQLDRSQVLISASVYSHNLRSHQKIRHAEYQGEGVTITTVRKSRSAQQSAFSAPSHSQASSLIISPPPPPNLLNLNSSDMKTSLPMYKSDWNLRSSRWGVSGGNHFFCWWSTCRGLGTRARLLQSRTNFIVTFPNETVSSQEKLVSRAFSSIRDLGWSACGAERRAIRSAQVVST